MSNNFGFIDIILLAMIAGFIILRLRNILGRRTGHDGKNPSSFDEKKYSQFKPETKVVPILKDVLEKNEKKEFLKGAEIAYENIITAFANGKKEELKKLLTKEIYINFEQAILQRDKENVKSELTFIGVKESSVEKFEKVNNDFFATVKIVCEIISVKKNKDNNVIEGNPDTIKTVTDHWIFTRSALNNNPNWFLTEIVSR
jgi:predicted lipid-binding transport protein (Tim44 family)|tara:strand:- start:684 stop:1286 length:603 start_codon:yes stop_codon:yes gene_type:complete